MKLSVIIPAHNEEATLERTVKELIKVLTQEKVDNEIIIVNDSSFDRTAVIAQDLENKYPAIKIVHRKLPSGFGLALREGFNKAKGEVIIPLMADSSDDPKDAIKLFRKIEEGYDVVYGSRFITGARTYDYPLLKLIINRVANNLIKCMFGLKENDITNAFKAYRREVIEKINPIEAREFNITLEVPLKAYIMGFTKTQIPVNWYGRESGVSKLRISQIGRHYLSTLLKIWFRWARNSFRRGNFS